MSRSDAYLPLLNAVRRRYEQEQDEPWKTVALSLAKKVLDFAERRERTGGCDIASILDAAARLPPDANGFRDTLWGGGLAAADDGRIGAIEARPVVPGVLVITLYGDLAIVMGEAQRPSKKWLRDQERPLRAPDGPFWTARVLRGGAAVFTAPDVHVAGAPDDDQIELALEMGTVATAKRLVELFPKLVDRFEREPLGKRVPGEGRVLDDDCLHERVAALSRSSFTQRSFSPSALRPFRFQRSYSPSSRSRT